MCTGTGTRYNVYYGRSVENRAKNDDPFQATVRYILKNDECWEHLCACEMHMQCSKLRAEKRSLISALWSQRSRQVFTPATDLISVRSPSCYISTASNPEKVTSETAIILPVNDGCKPTAVCCFLFSTRCLSFSVTSVDHMKIQLYSKLSSSSNFILLL